MCMQPEHFGKRRLFHGSKLFGTEDQKNRYLPKLAKAEMIPAYCLTEPQAGSDALGIKMRADLSPDGKYYVLNGQKMWITNGGLADLYTVFAKVNGEKFTAFLVERSCSDVKPGIEEKKMGMMGSSTTAVYFDNVAVPVENVLGEIGRGHIIAFNILNLGRLKLGACAIGNAKNILRLCSQYARDRKAFGKSIAEFGLIQQKLAEMAIRIFVTESMTYRTVGLIEGHFDRFSADRSSATHPPLAAVEEFAPECSYIKVFASEMLDYVVDEGVQIHGGYGYHQDYMVERAYRDSRINRLFEGTNEINRLLATGMLLKRAQHGHLPLFESVRKLNADILTNPPPLIGNQGETLVENAKKIFLFLVGVAYETFALSLENQQEVVASITDVAINTFAMDSVLLRVKKLARLPQHETPSEMCGVFLRGAMRAVENSARTVLAACSETDVLRSNITILERFTKFDPVDVFAARRRIAKKLLARNGGL